MMRRRRNRNNRQTNPHAHGLSLAHAQGVIPFWAIFDFSG
jgi:hypothetical protein